MTYDTYRLVFYAGIAFAVFFFFLAVILFFALNVPAVIGDLSGSTERKAIESIRYKNVNGSSKLGLEYGESQRLTGELGKTNRGRGNTSGMGNIINTTKFSTKSLEKEARHSYETTLLAPESNETTVLNAAGTSQETTVLSPLSNPTSVAGDVYGAGYGETAVLSQNPMRPAENVTGVSNQFIIEYEITLIHTEEIIA